VLFCDDSGSMAGDAGERIADLRLIVGQVAEVATLFDGDGIEVRRGTACGVECVC
jgi:hypothetical protein